MKKGLIGFILGLVVGAVAVMAYLVRSGEVDVAEAAQGSGRAAQTAGETVAHTMDRAEALLDAKLDALELGARDVQRDMESMGRVVRQRARTIGENVQNAATDARITTEMKAALVADDDLSALDISVSTTDGRVTLAGEVPSYDDIGQAMILALSIDGVREVVSTLQVDDRA